MRLRTEVQRPRKTPVRPAAWLLSLLVLLPLLRPASAEPALYRGGETVILDHAAGDDIYLAGGKVVLSGDVAGDALLAGGSVVVDGGVNEDLAAAGGSVFVNAEVGDDLRVAGGDVTITGGVGDDLAAFGGRVTVGRDAPVGGDLTVAAGTINAACPVAGSARLGGGTIVFTGDIAGDAEFHATERLEINGRIAGQTRFSAPKVRLGPMASFGGDVEYWTREGELDFGHALPAGEVRFNPEMRFAKALGGSRGSRRAAAGFLGAWIALSLLAGALTILVLVLLLRGHFDTAAEDLGNSFWGSCGIGFLYFIAAPVAAGLLLASLVGFPLGIALLAFYLLSLLFAKALSAVVLARWLERRRGRSWSRAGFFFAAFGIYLALKVAGFVPVAGWLAVLVFVCSAFGAMASADWKLFRQLRGTAPAPPSP